MDLSTPDLASARTFYQGVFGWECIDMGADFGHYHYALAQGRVAAGIGQMQPDAQTPSAWTIYFASAQGDAERVRALGGQIALEPMIIGDAGTMTIGIDPGGAFFGLWQPNNFIGAAVEGEHGSMAWSEVATRHAADLCGFYGELFGLTAHKVEDQEYFIMGRGEEMLFGIMQMDAQWGEMPPHWMIYFAVYDAEAALERALAVGGSVMVPAFDTPHGRVAVIADPFGAAFSIIQLPAA
jgi:predicted enzyme related to lactoylglutathione lyase